ncbi:MAG: response regulator [Flavobacteriales bacterium]|nr:response regulator [Flavobacteriales bacterium]
MSTDRYTILVEDDPTVLHSLRLQMRKILPPGFNIETANDGAEALELLQDIIAANGLIPLVVTDHQMPRMSGSEFLLRLKELFPKCRNIMLTGEARLDDITQLINEQALYRYISKPWSQSDLEMTVLSALEAYDQEYKLDQLNKKLAESNEHLEELVIERTLALQLTTMEINSGLEYARLVQQNLLPNKDLMQEYFSHVDLLFRPYHQVSGDFYTFSRRPESPHKAMLIIGDATGHGIAGAFLSNICMSIIDNLVENQVLQTPIEVLSEVLQRFRKLSHHATESMQQMISVELTVVCFDKLKNGISYASNSRQLKLFKNGAIVQPKEQIFPCCLGNSKDQLNLKHRGRFAELPLSDLDTVLLHTDGVQDQFMPDGKRLLRKGLRDAFSKPRLESVEQWFTELQGGESNTDDATLILVKL